MKKGKKDKVYHLRKTLYGLKQAPRAWNRKIDDYFHQNGFQRSKCEPLLYVNHEGTKDFLVICLYVDDLIYMGTNMKMVEDSKRAKMKEFEMTDLDLMKYFLGFQVQQSKSKAFICQQKYIEDLLKKFHMVAYKPESTPMSSNEKLQQKDVVEKADAKTYRSLIGSLIYLTNTRPNIVHESAQKATFCKSKKNYSLPTRH